jgi:hypothetical protein
MWRAGTEQQKCEYLPRDTGDYLHGIICILTGLLKANYNTNTGGGEKIKPVN